MFSLYQQICDVIFELEHSSTKEIQIIDYNEVSNVIIFTANTKLFSLYFSPTYLDIFSLKVSSA